MNLEEVVVKQHRYKDDNTLTNVKPLVVFNLFYFKNYDIMRRVFSDEYR